MIGRFAANLVSLLLAATIVACASKPVGPVERPVVRSIAVVPATEPKELTYKFESAAANMLGGGLMQLAILADTRAKATVFRDKMSTRRLDLATRLNTRVVESLRAAGYTVVVLDDVKRPVDDPDDVDISTLQGGADAILHLRIDEVGVASPRSVNTFQPRVNIQAQLRAGKVVDEIYDDKLYYGIDAQAKDPSTVLADVKFAYANFDDVMAHLDDLAQSFQDGTDALARRLATLLLETLATKARTDPAS